MKLLDMYDGFAVVAIHWTEAQLVFKALDKHEPADTKETELVDTMGTAWEALTFAGQLQVKTPEPQMTLRCFRAKQGFDDWQPSEALYADAPPAVAS